MFEKIQKLLFPLLIAFSALSVSLSAAYYSVSGLSKLFAGAAFAVIVMAASLEIAKLVIASLLYQYRNTLPKFLKYYLSIACFVLILITSMGIYGFLSAAYQETAAKSGNVEAQISLIETKRDNVKSQLVVYNEEKTSINNAVADLRTGLSNNVIRYTDTLGNVVTTTSSSTRRALEKQLDQAIGRQDIININYLLLTIIFVFDPLAIALVIAANFAFEQLKGKTKKNLYREIVPVKKEEVDIEYHKTLEAEEEEIFADLNYGREDEKIIESDSSLPKGYVSNELELLEEKLRNTPLVNKRGPDGRVNLKTKIDKLKNTEEGDDLVIKY